MPRHCTRCCSVSGLKPFISSELPKKVHRCKNQAHVSQFKKIPFRLSFKLLVNLHNCCSLAFSRLEIHERCLGATRLSLVSSRPSTDCVVCSALSEMLWL